jgi:hypothetical protein
LLRWYRAVFFGFFTYFKRWTDNDVTAASNAGIALLLLHGANVLAIAHGVSLATGQILLPYSWLKEWALPLVAFVVAYSWYFVTRTERIAAEFSDKERTAAVAWLAGRLYAGVSVVGLIGVLCL